MLLSRFPLFAHSILDANLVFATFTVYVKHVYEPSIDVYANVCVCARARTLVHACLCVEDHSGGYVIVSGLPLILESLECKWS